VFFIDSSIVLAVPYGYKNDFTYRFLTVQFAFCFPMYLSNPGQTLCDSCCVAVDFLCFLFFVLVLRPMLAVDCSSLTHHLLTHTLTGRTMSQLDALSCSSVLVTNINFVLFSTHTCVQIFAPDPAIPPYIHSPPTRISGPRFFSGRFIPFPYFQSIPYLHRCLLNSNHHPNPHLILSFCMCCPHPLTPSVVRCITIIIIVCHSHHSTLRPNSPQKRSLSSIIIFTSNLTILFFQGTHASLTGLCDDVPLAFGCFPYTFFTLLCCKKRFLYLFYFGFFTGAM